MKVSLSFWIVIMQTICIVALSKNRGQKAQVHSSRWWSSTFYPTATSTAEPTFPVAPQLSVESTVPTIASTSTSSPNPSLSPSTDSTTLPPTEFSRNPTIDPTDTQSIVPSLPNSLLPSEAPSVASTFPVAPQLSISTQPTILPTPLATSLPSTVVPPPAEGTIFEIVILTISLDEISYNAQTGLLTASGGIVTGTIEGLPFSTNIVNFSIQLSQSSTLQQNEGSSCAILNLELGAIYINLLGLRIDTTPICLIITSSSGGLLGNLLCNIASENIEQLPDLLDLLRDLLNFTLNQQHFAQDSVYGFDNSLCSGDCPVIGIIIGPVVLNILGLNIELDNCSNRPVRLCVSATAGEGILGELLCGITEGTFPVIANT